MPSLRLDRQTLAKFLPDHQSIVAFEKIFESIDGALPDGIEAATQLAYAATALANLAVSMLAQHSEEIDRLSYAPITVQPEKSDDYFPALATGTLSQQNADAVEITGGSIDGTTIGASVASTGAFTTLTASSTVTLSPANANVVISPSGTGLVTIAPATSGSMNNVDIGAVTAKSVRSTTLTATAAVSLSPAGANVVLSPTGAGVVTIAPATAGTLDNVDIGVTTPKTIKSTTLTATGAVSLSPANLNVVISPTGTGLVTVSPATAGTIDNVSLGVTTPLAVKSTTLTATGAVALSPANANVVISPTGTGVVTISPATAGTINNVSIGVTTAASVRGTTVTATGVFTSRGILDNSTANMLTITSAGIASFGSTIQFFDEQVNIVGGDTKLALRSSAGYTWGISNEGTSNVGKLTFRYEDGTLDVFVLDRSGNAVLNNTLTLKGGATFLTTSSALTNGAGAGAGTILNAPAAGNPTKWIGINDNGTTRYIPAW